MLCDNCGAIRGQISDWIEFEDSIPGTVDEYTKYKFCSWKCGLVFRIKHPLEYKHLRVLIDEIQEKLNRAFLLATEAKKTVVDVMKVYNARLSKVESVMNNAVTYDRLEEIKGKWRDEQ